MPMELYIVIVSSLNDMFQYIVLLNFTFIFVLPLPCLVKPDNIGFYFNSNSLSSDDPDYDGIPKRESWNPASIRLVQTIFHLYQSLSWLFHISI